MVRARRVVATHHDCTHERYPELFPDVKKVLWARKWLFPRVDAIICVSESCRQDLLHFYNVDPAKTRVIHHGAQSSSAQRGSRRQPAKAVAARLRAVCWYESRLQEFCRSVESISRNKTT